MAADVTASLDHGAIGDEVVVHAAVRAEPAAEHAPAYLVVGDLQVDHTVDVVALHEELGLPPVARKAVDDEAEVPVVLIEPLADHRLDEVVADQLAGVHGAAHLGAHFGVVLHMPAEDVADTDVHHVEVAAEHRALGSLAAALDAHNHVLVHVPSLSRRRRCAAAPRRAAR
jgi:hypothetical protein